MPTERPSYQEVIERLELVERQNRIWKRAGLGVLILASAIVLMGQTVPKSRTVEAEKFVLKDASGRDRGELKMFLEGPALTFYDSEGKSRIELQSLPDQTSLLFLDDKGKIRTALGMTAGVQAFTLFDTSGKERVMVQVGEQGAGIWLYTSEGKVLWSAPASAASSGSTQRGERPRVFIEAWSGGGIWKSQLKAEPLDEIATFNRNCPEAVVTIEKQNADYSLRLEHHLAGGDFLRQKNPPPDYGLDYHRYTLFDTDGSVLLAGTKPTLGEAVEQACKDIMRRRASPK